MDELTRITDLYKCNYLFTNTIDGHNICYLFDLLADKIIDVPANNKTYKTNLLRNTIDLIPVEKSKSCCKN